MNRRDFLGAAASAAVLFAGRLAFAGSYLDRAALMLDGGRKEIDMVKSRTSDKELLLVVKSLTDARVKAGRKMNVPAAVVDAHPHLLLVLENYDRALDALLASNLKKWSECLVNAADEERTFRAMMKTAGYALPKT